MNRDTPPATFRFQRKRAWGGMATGALLVVLGFALMLIVGHKLFLLVAFVGASYLAQQWRQSKLDRLPSREGSIRLDGDTIELHTGRARTVSDVAIEVGERRELVLTTTTGKRVRLHAGDFASSDAFEACIEACLDASGKEHLRTPPGITPDDVATFRANLDESLTRSEIEERWEQYLREESSVSEDEAYRRALASELEQLE